MMKVYTVEFCVHQTGTPDTWAKSAAFTDRMKAEVYASTEKRRIPILMVRVVEKVVTEKVFRRGRYDDRGTYGQHWVPADAIVMFEELKPSEQRLCFDLDVGCIRLVAGWDTVSDYGIERVQ